MIRKAMLAASVLLLAAPPAMAQMTSAAPPAGVRLQKLPPARSVSLALALEAAQTAQAACIAKNAPTTVAVYDVNGNVKVMLSADGAETSSYEYVRKKTYTVLHKNMASGDYGKSLGPNAGNGPFEGDANLIQYAGAIPIRRGAELVGVLAVSGPTGQVDDEICAKAGLEKIQSRL